MSEIVLADLHSPDRPALELLDCQYGADHPALSREPESGALEAGAAVDRALRAGHVVVLVAEKNVSNPWDRAKLLGDYSPFGEDTMPVVDGLLIPAPRLRGVYAALKGLASVGGLAAAISSLPRVKGAPGRMDLMPTRDLFSQMTRKLSEVASRALSEQGSPTTHLKFGEPTRTRLFDTAGDAMHILERILWATTLDDEPSSPGGVTIVTAKLDASNQDLPVGRTYSKFEIKHSPTLT